MVPFHILEAFLSGDFSSLWPPLAAVFTGAYNEAKSMWDDFRNELNPWEDLKKWVKSYYDDIVPSQMERIRKDIEELLKNVKEVGQEVFQEIADTVGDILDTGVVPPQTDGHLGETRDIYTPDGDVPLDVGTMPGMGSPGAGMDRDSGGGYSGGGYGGGSTGGTTPLGGSPSTPSPSGGAQPPTNEDLGIGPDEYAEYQPTEGQVVITHADGTTEIRPWPPT